MERAERVLWLKRMTRNRHAHLFVDYHQLIYTSVSTVTIQGLLSNATAGKHECPSSIRRRGCGPATRFVSSLGLQNNCLAVHLCHLENPTLSQASGLVSTSWAKSMGKKILGILVGEIESNARCPARSGGKGRRATEGWRKQPR